MKQNDFDRDAENARQENAGPICRVGKCRTGKWGKRHCMEHRVLLIKLSPARCDHWVCLKGAGVAPVPVWSWTINHDSSDE